MICVLDGKAANRRSVPRVPKVTAPRMPSWVARFNNCESHRRERAAKQKERNGKAEKKNKAAQRERTHKHNERTNKNNERKNKEAHRERVNKHNERKNKEAHRERVNKHNERKHKAANTCKHRAIIYQHYHFRGYARHFHRGRYDMHAMMRKGVKNDDAVPRRSTAAASSSSTSTADSMGVMRRSSATTTVGATLTGTISHAAVSETTI